MSLIKFVKGLKNAAASNHGSLRFVVGNSSADFDSIFGSILYAYFLTQSMDCPHLPLLDCPQADMPLRFEASLVLSRLGVSAGDLLYTEMFVDLYKSNHTFYLYDHNYRPEISSAHLAEIVDHHAIQDEISCPHLITHCASALTLIYYLYHPHQLTHSNP